MFDKLIIPVLIVAAVGTFGRALYLSHVIDAQAQPFAAAAPPATEPTIDDLARAVGLTSQQASAMHNILESHRNAMQAFEESLRPQRDAMRDVVQQNVAVVLNAEQLSKFEAWQAAYHPKHPYPAEGARWPASDHDE